MRLSRRQMMLNIAGTVKRRGTCARNRVGVVITNLEMTAILSMGYNGNFRGGPNTCDAPQKQGECGCIHAEENALIKAPYLPGQLILFSTTSPCLDCAKLIINAGITQVVYEDAYRSPAGILLLRTNGVAVYHGDKKEQL